MSHQDSPVGGTAGPATVPAATGHPADDSADRRAAGAVVAHHAQLSAALGALAERVVEAAERADVRDVFRARAELVSWLHAELLPHATAEEAVLYPAAAELTPGALLVDGMVDEHRTIVALVDELASSATPVRAAAAARALTALFGTHLTKENELILPLLLSSGAAGLAELLEGMHDLLGGGEAAGCGCGHDGPGEDGHGHDGHGHDGHGHKAAAAGQVGAGAAEPGGERGGGCGGACGCGGDAPGGAAAEAPVLSIDPRLDVREIPHDRRHATVLAALDSVPAGGALVLVAPHAPRPLLAEIEARHPGRFELDWLQEGPTVWQLRLQRAAALV